MYKEGTMAQKKDNFRHIVTISTYMLGLSLSIFSILIAHVSYRFGISFWLCIGTLILFVAVIVYEQISIRKVIKESLIKDLLEKEISNRNKKIKESNVEFIGHI
jgi:hypothetical protein